MRRNIKKYIRLGLSGLMICGLMFLMPGSLGKVRAGAGNVFQVVFPANTDHVFDFIMDPQELIRMTDAAAYGGLSFEEGANLFFRRHDGRAETDYSSSSDALVITNIGTVDVEIAVSAHISLDSVEKITMTGDSTFAEDTEASLYLALTDGERIVPILEGEDAVLQMTLAGSEGMDTPEEYRFWLVGAVNGNGDWSEVKGEAPKVTVTWSASAGEAEEPETGDTAEEESREEALPESVEETSEMLPETLPEMSEEENTVKETEMPETEEYRESGAPENGGDPNADGEVAEEGA